VSFLPSRIRIRLPKANLEPDPDQPIKINADPNPQHWQTVMELKFWKYLKGKLPNAKMSRRAEINFNWL
jgi:hypothetical protein